MLRQHRIMIHFLFMLTLGFVGGCGDGRQQTSATVQMKSEHAAPRQQTTSLNRFPTGKFKAQDIVLEVKGGPTFHAKEMNLFDVVATITPVGVDKIKIETSGRMRRAPGGPTKNDNRVDYYSVQWANDEHGRLVNQNTAQPRGDFSLTKGALTIKAWVARNNAWETQIYTPID